MMHALKGNRCMCPNCCWRNGWLLQPFPRYQLPAGELKWACDSMFCNTCRRCHAHISEGPLQVRSTLSTFPGGGVPAPETFLAICGWSCAGLQAHCRAAFKMGWSHSAVVTLLMPVLCHRVVATSKAARSASLRGRQQLQLQSQTTIISKRG